MSDTPAHRRDLNGWALAATLGLLAVAFAWDRVAPPQSESSHSGLKSSVTENAGIAGDGDALVDGPSTKRDTFNRLHEHLSRLADEVEQAIRAGKTA